MFPIKVACHYVVNGKLFAVIMIGALSSDLAVIVISN